MKTHIIILLILISLNIKAQSDFNYITPHDFSLQKDGSKSNQKVTVAELKNLISAENCFGLDHKTESYTEVMSDRKFIRVSYNDGLRLDISQDNNLTFFNITSNKYKMILNSGRVIKVGMKAQELEEIFPKSYANRNAYRASKNGKISFNVYYSYMQDNKVIRTASWIIFVLDKENGNLERFYLFEPE